MRRRDVHQEFEDVVSTELVGLLRYATAPAGDPHQGNDIVTVEADAIGLVPAGWAHLAHQGPVTYYGPADVSKSEVGDFAKLIAADVHERTLPDGPNDLTVTGRPARYSASDGFQTVSVIVNATTEMDVYVPPAAHLTRTQALRVAQTLELRSTAQKTHG